MRVLLPAESSSCTQRLLRHRRRRNLRHPCSTRSHRNVVIFCTAGRPLSESLEGLENVEKIAAVEGIDMIAYRHSDLRAQLGVHLDLEHPKFKAAVRRIAAACNAHGKLARGGAAS